MALRNAFGAIALEETLRNILRAVTFAKDSSERLQVVVQNQPGMSVYNGNTATSAVQGLSPGYHNPNTWNVVDGRVEIQELSQQNFQMTRSRWSIT